MIMGEDGYCYMCGAELKEGSQIHGSIHFIFGSFPICLDCGSEMDINDVEFKS